MPLCSLILLCKSSGRVINYSLNYIVVSKMNTNSFSIPMPWGSLAGKTWGNNQNIPVLVVHGRQDNCGTFDPLIPLLPREYFYVCIDLPGHGKSLPFPLGAPLKFFDYVLTLKRVIDHFSWKEIICLGHSFGGQISLYLAALYPEIVKKVIGFDCVGTDSVDTSKLVSHYRSQFDEFLKQEKKLNNVKPPCYSYDEAVSRTKNNRWLSSLTDKACATLIARSLVPNGDGYYFSTDQRFKLGVMSGLTSDQQIAVFKQIKCPVLLVLADNTVNVFFAKNESVKHLYQYFKTSALNASVVIVNGNHDVHLNYPERVLPFVKSFLSNERSKL